MLDYQQHLKSIGMYGIIINTYKNLKLNKFKIYKKIIQKLLVIKQEKFYNYCLNKKPKKKFMLIVREEQDHNHCKNLLIHF